MSSKSSSGIRSTVNVLGCQQRLKNVPSNSSTYACRDCLLRAWYVTLQRSTLFRILVLLHFTPHLLLAFGVYFAHRNGNSLLTKVHPSSSYRAYDHMPNCSGAFEVSSQSTPKMCIPSYHGALSSNVWDIQSIDLASRCPYLLGSLPTENLATFCKEADSSLMRIKRRKLC